MSTTLLMLSFSVRPLFLAGAAAAAVPIVLHLLKREPEDRVKFAPVQLIKQAPVEHTDRRRLRELLLLALRVTALVLLALAFARPFLRDRRGGRIDRRHRRRARHVLQPRRRPDASIVPGSWRRTRSPRRRPAISSASSRSRTKRKSWRGRARIARSRSTRSSRRRPGYGATRYRAALSAASQHLAGRHGTVVVVTDLQESGWDAGDRASVPDGTTIRIADVGAMPPNLAVTAVRPMPDRVVATVRNAGPRPRDARVHLRIDGRPAGDATVSLGANQSAEAVFAGAPRGASAAVSVDDGEGIQADNVRYAVIGGSSKPSVLVVTGIGRREPRCLLRAARAGGRHGAGLGLSDRGRQLRGAGRMVRGSADAACRRPAALDARARAPRTGAAGRVRAARRRHLHRRGPGGRRRRRRRRARRRIDAADCDGRRARSRRRECLRRPTAAIPCSRRLREIRRAWGW